jgi:uncharacterized protein (DUF302 family)
MGNIIHSAYHISLEEEIKRLKEELIKSGINNPNRIEVTALIAHKNKRAKMFKSEVIDFFKNLRGFK